MTDILRYAAFTQDPAGGNPAGVVLDARGMSEADMQRVAAEVGYSETAFVVTAGPEERRYRLRYFSPMAEVPFCGHATIATAVVLAERTGPGLLVFDTPPGEIQVETTAEPTGIRASLRSVPTRSRPATGEELTEVLSCLRWSTDDLAEEFPPHVAFAGNEHFILGVRTRQRLAELQYDYDRLLALMTVKEWTTLQLFWAESEDLVHARDPFPVGDAVPIPS